MPQPHCIRCGGSGMLVEYRLIWKRPREGQAAIECCRRVDDAQAGWDQGDRLEEGAFDVNVLSGVKDCPCRKPEKGPEPVLALDYKMRQAGDR